MSLSYDFEKWIIISMASIASSLTIGFVLMQYAHGQTETQQQQKESLQALLDYCFQHADRPNPLQDLIDKGFLSLNFTGETCKSVKQMYDLLEIKISEYNKNQTAELEENERRLHEFMECERNQTTTHEECRRIQETIK